MILCVGTTPAIQRTMVFDKVTLNGVNRATDVLHTGGGKSINVARVLRTLGQDVVATGFLGGVTGEFIRRELQSLGVQTDFVTVAPATRICVTAVDRAARHATELVEETAPVEASAWAPLLKKIEDHMTDAKAVILSGSLPPKAPEDFYARCAEFASARKIPTILDTRGQPLALALPYHPILVKPNRSELAGMLGRPLDSDDALRPGMRELVDRGAQWMLITMGKDGAMLSDGRRFWRIPAVRVPTFNPIGSGDAFAAGTTTALLRGQEMPEACRLGAACAAANAMTMAAGHVDLNEVNRLIDQVRIEILQ